MHLKVGSTQEIWQVTGCLSQGYRSFPTLNESSASYQGYYCPRGRKISQSSQHFSGSPVFDQVLLVKTVHVFRSSCFRCSCPTLHLANGILSLWPTVPLMGVTVPLLMSLCCSLSTLTGALAVFVADMVSASAT